MSYLKIYPKRIIATLNAAGDFEGIFTLHIPTQQMGGGMPQQQPNVANPTQLQQPLHKPLTQQQMLLKRRNSGFLSRNSSV